MSKFGLFNDAETAKILEVITILKEKKLRSFDMERDELMDEVIYDLKWFIEQN